MQLSNLLNTLKFYVNNLEDPEVKSREEKGQKESKRGGSNRRIVNNRKNQGTAKDGVSKEGSIQDGNNVRSSKRSKDIKNSRRSSMKS